MKYARYLVLISIALTALSDLADANGAYEVTTTQLPKGIEFEVGGMDFRKDGALFICTRIGDVWFYKDETWKKFAGGLQEPLGLVVGEEPGEVFVLQRTELTRLVDKNADGRAEVFETFGSGWDYEGTFHGYAMGLIRDPEGSFYGNLGLEIDAENTHDGAWLGTRTARWRGWHFKITKDGTFVPLSPGTRTANGIVRSPDGDIFISDNQGSYIASGWLMHAVPGEFLGHPAGLKWDNRYSSKLASMTVDDFDKLRKRPAIYFPYPRMGRSASEPVFDTTGGKFGPYAGQIFIGDVTQELLMRCSLENVKETWQGACYPFLRKGDLGAGNNRLRFDAKGQLFIGQAARGWAKGSGLQVVRWLGKTPKTVLDVEIRRRGFMLSFTQAVDPAAAALRANYEVRSFRYEYTSKYYADQLDVQTVKPNHVKVLDGGKRVLIGLPLEEDRVYRIRTKHLGLEFAGESFYTVNKIP